MSAKGQNAAGPIDPSFVYVAHFNAHGHDYIRVGYADNVERRIGQLQADMPFQINLAYKRPSRNRARAKADEYAAAAAVGIDPRRRGWVEGDHAAAVAKIDALLGPPDADTRHHIYLNNRR
jgi:hypothetical protein